MLDRLASWIVTRRRFVLVGAVVFVLAAGAIGGGVAKHLSAGGFDDPKSENSQVLRLVDREFPNGATPNVVLLVLVFGSAVAASLPLAIGAMSVVGTFLILRVLASLTQVSIFSLNLTTALGLGLAIDYSLFIVSRYREELHSPQAWAPRQAIARTMNTAGRTVLFSALTVAISLAALLLFPLAFLRSFAYAGIGVVFMAAAGALIVLPAMLAALGPRIDRLSLRKHRPPVEPGQGFWHRVAMAVM